MADVWFLPLKQLELALNNGISFTTGKQEGLPTGDPSFFKTFDALMVALKKQIIYDIERKVKIANAQEKYVSKISPDPLLSLTLADCTESGKDVTEGGTRYNNTGTTIGLGLANTADALVAIKKIVFEEKKITLVELVNALKTNFLFKESLRCELINRMPKYGNDDDSVDLLAKEIVDIYAKEIPNHHNTRGGYFKLGLWGTDYVVKGKEVGASADGRLVGEPLSANLSPAPGRALRGATSIIKSATKIDQSYPPTDPTLTSS